MDRFKAARGEVRAESVRFTADDGSFIDVGAGDVVAVYRGDRAGFVLIAADLARGVRLVVDQASFDAKGFLGAKATGNPTVDTERVGQVLCRLGTNLTLQQLAPAAPTPTAPPPTAPPHNPFARAPTPMAMPAVSPTAPVNNPFARAPTPMAMPAVSPTAPVNNPFARAPTPAAMTTTTTTPSTTPQPPPSPFARAAPPPPAAPAAPAPPPSNALLSFASDDDGSGSGLDLGTGPGNNVAAEEGVDHRQVFSVGAMPTDTAPKGPRCLNCEKDLKDAKSHYIINERPWCEACAFSSLEPPLGAGVWLALRGVVSAGLVITAWFTAMRQQMPIIVAAPAAVLSLVSAAGLFFRGERPPHQPAERYAGAPGGRGAQLARHPPEHLKHYVRQRWSEEGSTVVSLVIVAALCVVGHFSFAKPVERWPQTLFWRKLEYSLRSTQTLGKLDVTVARLYRPMQPPSEASSSLGLMRGSLSPAELRTAVLEDVGIKRADVIEIDASTFCFILPGKQVDSAVITTTGVCAWGGCAVQGIAYVDAGGTCYPDPEHVGELKKMLTKSWTK